MTPPVGFWLTDQQTWLLCASMLLIGASLMWCLARGRVIR